MAFILDTKQLSNIKNFLAAYSQKVEGQFAGRGCGPDTGRLPTEKKDLQKLDTLRYWAYLLRKNERGFDTLSAVEKNDLKKITQDQEMLTAQASRAMNRLSVVANDPRQLAGAGSRSAYYKKYTNEETCRSTGTTRFNDNIGKDSRTKSINGILVKDNTQVQAVLANLPKGTQVNVESYRSPANNFWLRTAVVGGFAIGGALLGAAAGTIVPGPGNAAGGVLGWQAGAAAGAGVLALIGIGTQVKQQSSKGTLTYTQSFRI